MTQTSWGKVSTQYDDLLERGKDTYQGKLILPNLKRLLQIKKGERVLDLACGQGFFAERLMTPGALMDGVDISKEMIALARSRKTSVRYEVANAVSLPFESGVFDKIFSVLAVQNFEDLSGSFKEAARVIKEKGLFLMVINHPAFRNPKFSSWGFDDKKGVQYRRVDRYLSESKVEIEMNPGLKNDLQTISFHRPLQAYAKALANAGFLIARIEEWTSHRLSEPGPRKAAEDRARKEFPLFMMIEAIKIHK